MIFKIIGRFLSRILIVEALFMLPAMLISVWDGERITAQGFGVSIAITLAVGILLWGICRRFRVRNFYAREGLVCVGVSWIVMSLFGCLPFLLSGEIPRFVDAFFEIVSGFTTTGSSVVPQVETLTRGVLYWRSFSHWLGGMGVLVFVLAVLPSGKQSDGFSIQLLRAESPGPDVGKLVPKIRKTATILYVMYFVLTVLNIVFLLCGGMSLFDSLCTAFGTAGTGGFGIRNDSMASFSPYLQTVTTVFMLLFGINFSCYYLLMLRQFKPILKDEELRVYLGVVLTAIVLIVINLRDYYGTIAETIRHAAFQVSSVITTTGYTTTDFDKWPTFSKAILLVLMLIGACAGSTGGGMKCGRMLLLLKDLKRRIGQALHPQKVAVIRQNGHTVDEAVIKNANAFLFAYVVILSVSFLIVSWDGFSLTGSFSAVMACFNNVGPALAEAGPLSNFGNFSDLSKLVLTFDMLAGRLEIFPMLVLATRGAWTRR